MTPDVMTKIKALLAMAEHPNSNVNEAAIALEKAQKLLLENNLTRAEINVDNNTDDGVGKIDLDIFSGFSWKSVLVNVMAKSMMCSMVRTPSLKKLHLFGTESNVEAVCEMFFWVVPQLDAMANLGWTARKNRFENENGKNWKQGFYLGACRAIEERIRKPYSDFSAGQGRSIVLYNDKAVQEAVHRVYPRVKAGTKISGGSYAGHAEGYIAGKKISLSSAGRIGGKLVLSGARQ